MKTASKFLSMLLLVAMCLSLMGGSAFALSLEPAGGELALGLPAEDSSAAPEESSTFSLRLGGTEAVPEGSTTLALDKPSTYTAPENIWTAGGKGHPTLQAAVDAAGANGTVTLNPEVTDDPVVDSGATINTTVTIDLSGKNLKVKALVIDAKGNVTLVNGGTVTADSSVVIMKGGVLNDPGKIVPTDIITNNGTISTEGETVATVNGKNFDTVEGALDYAKGLTSAVTITFAHNPHLANIEIETWPVMSCSSLTLNLNDNGILLTKAFTVSKPMVLNGSNAVFNGELVVQGGSLTVNSGVKLGAASVGGDGIISVNGGEVYALELDGGVLNMSRGTIDALTISDTVKASKLNVSGGTVIDFVTPDPIVVLPERAITGGTWGVLTGGLTYFDGCIVKGYVRTGSNPYTVSGNGVDDDNNNGVVNGDFTVVGSPYTKYGTGTVYVLMPYTSHNGAYYWSTVENPTLKSQINEISSASYDAPVLVGSQYKLTLKNTFLDTLPTGTVYLGTCNASGNYQTMGPLTVLQSGSTPINPGDAAVWPVESTWYSGSGLFYFYVTPALQLVEGTNYDYYDVRIDNVQVGGDKLAYNGYQKFGVASSVMDSLTTGTHSISVLTTAGYASCNFRVGATLRPVDTDKHVIGSSKNLQFVCSDSISRVWVGSTELTNLNYGDYWTLSSSGKIITLTAKFMNNQLSAGSTYTLTVQTPNGDRPSCSFQILTTAQAAYSPQTGDTSNLALWATVLVLAGGAAVAILPRLKKHED